LPILDLRVCDSLYSAVLAQPFHKSKFKNHKSKFEMKGGHYG